ncbi:MAG: histidine phosphatase family protein, partial [Actinomycetota bacterium]
MGERQIILWRHGRTSWNAERRFQGQSDIELDDEGRAQAERAAELLAYLEPDRIIASDLARAWATAQALSARTGVQVRADARLRETFAGEWEGLSRAELLERCGDEV